MRIPRPSLTPDEIYAIRMSGRVRVSALLDYYPWGQWLFAKHRRKCDCADYIFYRFMRFKRYTAFHSDKKHIAYVMDTWREICNRLCYSTRNSYFGPGIEIGHTFGEGQLHFTRAWVNGELIDLTWDQFRSQEKTHRAVRAVEFRLEREQRRLEAPARELAKQKKQWLRRKAEKAAASRNVGVAA